MRSRFLSALTVALLLAFAHPGIGAAQAVHVAEATICLDVVDRAPVGPVEIVPADTVRVYCFTRIDGAAGETEVTHNWYYQGALKASVVLPVRNDNWRTWSSKRLIPEWKGEWMVEVLAQDGTALESVVFLVQ